LPHFGVAFDDRFVAREVPERIPLWVGHNLAHFRQLRGWTQAQAAKRLKVSVRHLQRLEGGWNMQILTAARLARKYGVHTWMLFSAPRMKLLHRQPGRPRRKPTSVVVGGPVESADESE
jgi:DNA-binding XRE family transcriptional regulator